MTSAEFEAEEIIKNFGIAVPVNPGSLCTLLSSNSLKIEYHEREIETENICGMSIVNNDTVHIIVNSNIDVPSRRLFTAAHEIGHVILHIQTGKTVKSECSSKDISENNGESIEFEANQFASALLMPRHLIEKKIIRNDLTWSLIKDLSQHYNTSLEATARRVIGLNKEMCALIIHDKDKMWTPTRSNSFPCFIPILIFPKNLHFITCDESNFPDELDECDLLDWNLNLNKKQYNCYYSTLNFQDYSKKMTLLFLEEREVEDEDEWEPAKF